MGKAKGYIDIIANKRKKNRRANIRDWFLPDDLEGTYCMEWLISTTHTIQEDGGIPFDNCKEGILPNKNEDMRRELSINHFVDKEYSWGESSVLHINIAYLSFADDYNDPGVFIYQWLKRLERKTEFKICDFLIQVAQEDERPIVFCFDFHKNKIRRFSDPPVDIYDEKRGKSIPFEKASKRLKASIGIFEE